MFPFASLLTTPILGGLAITLLLGLAGTFLHGCDVSRQLAAVQKENKVCNDAINDPTTGWAVRFKTSQNNETVLKTELDSRNADVERQAQETKDRDAASEKRLADLRTQNAGLARQVRAIVSTPLPTTDVARQAVQLILGGLQP